MGKQSGNTNLRKANKAKNDEFYTQLSDIEKELGNYKEHFKGKTIFCNCDDPEESNFFKYFALNFDHIGIKKLVSTHFETEKPSYKLEITRGLDLNNDGKVDLKDTKKTPLKQNGDFRSDEAIEILKEADIVVTNPPFSLFREYVAQLFEYEKKFIIIGNQNAITYKEVFKIIKENKIWLGNTFPKQFKEPNGNMKKFGNIAWFTNLETQKRHENLILYKTYNKKEYPKYDNYEGINVDKVKEIPVDYKGNIGVPITFLGNYNPEQFEILDLSRYMKTQGMSQEFVDAYYKSGQTGSISEGHPDLCYYDKNGRPTVPYMRIIIKNKKL